MNLDNRYTQEYLDDRHTQVYLDKTLADIAGTKSFVAAGGLGQSC